MSDKNWKKSLPCSAEMETAYLSILLIHGNHDEYRWMSEELTSSDFYFESNGKLFEIVSSLYARKINISQSYLKEYLADNSYVDAVGGYERIDELYEIYMDPMYAETARDIIRRKRVLRDMIRIGSVTASLSMDPDADPNDVIATTENAIINASEGISSRGVKSVAVLSRDVIDFIMKRNENGGLLGISTGFEDLDFTLSGLQKSHLIVLAGRPSMGKTSLALNIAVNCAKNDIPVYIASMDTSPRSLILRMAISDMELNSKGFRAGNLSDEDKTAMVKAIRHVSKYPIFVDDSGQITPQLIRRNAVFLQRKHKIGLIVIDYLQLITSHDRAENRNLQIGAIMKYLRETAKMLDIPILLLSQLSRQVESREDKMPVLSDLRDSGSIEAEADEVLLMYRKAYYSKDDDKNKDNITDVNIAKQKDGPTGHVKLMFIPEFWKFKTYEEDYDPFSED